MMKHLVIALLVMICTGQASAQQWEKRVFVANEFKLPYQIYVPQSDVALPLIIHLHGSGEAGVDNIAQMYAGSEVGPQYFTNAERQARHPAIVLAPQTPKPMRWASTSNQPYDFMKTPSTDSMTALLTLIDELLAEDELVDARRVYITGLSRGGQGAWNAILQRPELFAAAVPIAGAADPAKAQRLIELPIWVFAAQHDRITSAQFSREMVDAVIRNGGSTQLIKYTEVINGRHHHAWERAYEGDELFDWLLQQEKPSP